MVRQTPVSSICDSSVTLESKQLEKHLNKLRSKTDMHDQISKTGCKVVLRTFLDVDYFYFQTYLYNIGTANLENDYSSDVIYFNTYEKKYLKFLA